MGKLRKGWGRNTNWHGGENLLRNSRREILKKEASEPDIFKENYIKIASKKRN